MRYYRFLSPSSTKKTEPTSPDHFVVSEADGTSWIYFNLDSSTAAEKLAKDHGFTTWEAVDLKQYVDWGVEWSTHNPDFQDHELRIDLSKYAEKLEIDHPLRLVAGPGFGDLSHPTTRLCLQMLARHVRGRPFIDVGCGSGILSLAAVMMGATSVTGIDIDPEALVHARQNAAINGLEKHVRFLLAQDFQEPIRPQSVVVMNMITSQQREAWNSLPQLHQANAIWITSGILVTERDAYLKECSTRGWEIVDEQCEGDWMAVQAMKSSRESGARSQEIGNSSNS